MTITSLNLADGTVGRSRLLLLSHPSTIGIKRAGLVRRKCRRATEDNNKVDLCESCKKIQKLEESGIKVITPRLKKRYVVAAAIVVIICACVGLASHFGLFSKKKEEEVLVPPNPTRALPSSSSRLHIFRKSAVCADGAVCAEIGRSVLEQGGNAVDAAIATMFCNGIVTMQSMGLGGGFLMTVYIKQNRTAYSLNARETAPLKAKPELYKDDPLKSQSGALAVAVPGELKGYWTAHRRFGKMNWKDVIRPSIELCEGGYNVTRHQYDSSFRNKLMQKDVTFREWFFDSDGERKKAGSVVVPTQLCRTLKLIADNGGDDLYNGTLSRMLLKDLEEIGSIISKDDLENYEAKWMDPVSVEFRNGDQLYSVPPPGSGVLLAFIMNILDGFKFTPKSIDGVQNTVETYHRIAEAFKYAYAKRTELGDTSFVNITDLMRNLTSGQYAAEIREKIKDNSTSQNSRDYGAVFYSRDDHGTAHISVLAENGDAVSITSSINIYFGSGHISKGTGIILNSVMDDFSFPYFKNYFGLPGSPNNELKPGKRPLSSMSPAILVDKNGDAKIVIGASGGTKITSAVALVIMRILWFGQNIKEAVDAPRFHHQLFPMEIQYEYGTLQQVVDGLRGLGHNLTRYSDNGSIICALLKEAGQITANADYRKGGDVSGI